MAHESIVTVTNESFDEVIKGDTPILVDFWAAWCGPCRMIAPILDHLAEEYKGKLRIGKVNVDEQGELAAKFSVMSIPTLLLLKNGEIAAKLVGARPKADFVKEIENHIG